jgi:hypothetical protein
LIHRNGKIAVRLLPMFAAATAENLEKRRHNLSASAGTGPTRNTNGAMQNELESGSRSRDEMFV